MVTSVKFIMTRHCGCSPAAAKTAKPAPGAEGARGTARGSCARLRSGEPGNSGYLFNDAPAARVAHNVIVSVWSMLEECVRQLDEPFRRSEVMGWFRRHYPEVKETTVAAHIYAATANAVNRVENHPYLGRRPPLLRRIDHGLYVRAAGSGADTDLIASNAAARQSEAAASAPHPRSRVHDRARGNVEALVDSFDDYVLRFEASNIFSGPSVYFHRRAIERRRLHGTAEDLLADELFLEYVYAVLPSWGMHRMVGPLGRDRQDPGDVGTVLRVAQGREAEQRMDRGQPGVTAADGVAPLALEVVEECADHRRVQVGDIQAAR